MKGAALGATGAAGSVGKAVGEGVAAGVGALGAGPKTAETAKNIAEGAAIGGLTGGIIDRAQSKPLQTVGEVLIFGLIGPVIGTKAEKLFDKYLGK